MGKICQPLMNLFANWSRSSSSARKASGARGSVQAAGLGSALLTTPSSSRMSCCGSRLAAERSSHLRTPRLSPKYKEKPNKKRSQRRRAREGGGKTKKQSDGQKHRQYEVFACTAAVTSISSAF